MSFGVPTDAADIPRQYRYRSEQVAHPQPLQYDPKPSFSLPRRSQATPTGGHTRLGHMYGVTPLGAIGEDDGELRSVRRADNRGLTSYA